MGAIELFRVALRYTFAFGRGYLSTFLSGLSMVGLVVAIALLITVMSVMNGFDREMRERILSLVPHLTLYSHYPVDNWDPLRKQVMQHPEVISASVFGRFDALLINNAKIETAAVLGMDMTAERLPVQLRDYLSPEQVKEAAEDPSALLLGAQLGRSLGVGEGDVLTLVVPSSDRLDPQAARFASFNVRGLLQTGTELDNSAALVHLAAVERVRGADGAVAGLRLTTSNIFAVSDIGWQLRSELPPGFYLTNWMNTHGNLYAAIQLSRDLIAVLLFSIIAVAAFNVVSSLVLVVFDKRADIAILRTLGASPRQVLVLFLMQGALIGFVGVVLGSLLGVVGSLVVTDLVAVLERLLDYQFLNTDVYPVSFLPSDLLWSDVLTIAVVAFIMCLLAAIYPARRAAKLAPAMVLAAD